ncbi:hypothetical protein JRI60_15675 [Archangium violaceum]|uniref:hypothetical protein n=1 Tax=Archangium violaceum TaxID=83451 RepID=UPI0019528388|nr:hypothetical protein [Archangium violaceum]QRO00361.1 hypothetical protein JRI60_15675 [Archangium violaceum]
MLRRTSVALFSLTLAACATSQQGNTRQVMERVDKRFLTREQCQPTRTASLAHEQVSGLDELPRSLRDRLLADLPLEAVGSTKSAQCQEAAARLLEDRLRALCWMEARVTLQGDTAAGAPAPLPRLNVQLGSSYQVDTIIWVTLDRNATVSPARVIETAKSALPKDKACTVRTLEDIRASVSKLGTFHQVLVEPGPPNTENKTVPVVVNINEKDPAPPKTQEPVPDKK